MTLQEAQAIAQQLGDIPVNSEKLQAEIQRLNRKGFVPLVHSLIICPFNKILSQHSKYLKL